MALWMKCDTFFSRLFVLSISSNKNGMDNTAQNGHPHIVPNDSDNNTFIVLSLDEGRREKANASVMEYMANDEGRNAKALTVPSVE